jgi:hypothetical protein
MLAHNESMIEQYNDYHSHRLPTTPLKGKAAFLDKWPEKAVKMLDFKTLLEEEGIRSTYGITGFGLALGKASNILALDIDTDDEEIIKLCPRSPLVKRGKTGETRFFKYDENIKNFPRRQGGMDYFVEILNDGKQTVMPPSIHPDTGKPYFWLSPDTLPNFDIDQLPNLDISFLKQVKQVCERKIKESKTKEAEKSNPKDNKTSGRNNACITFITKEFYNGARDFNKLATKLVRFDLEQHSSNPLFNDEEEIKKGSTPTQKALILINNVAKTNLESIEAKEKGLPKIEILTDSQDDDDDTYLSIQETKEEIIYPTPPEGAMRDLYEYILQHSRKPSEQISLAMSLCFFGTILGNKYSMSDTYTNLYALVLAPTGGGKTEAIKILKHVLRAGDFDSVKITEGSYTSGKGVLQGLMKHPIQLRIIDEAQEMFKTMSGDASGWQSQASKLCALWSAGGQLFQDVQLKESGKKDEKDFIDSPQLNLISFSQPKVFKNFINETLIENGFFPRNIFFVQKTFIKKKNTVRNSVHLPNPPSRILDVIFKASKNTMFPAQINVKNDVLDVFEGISNYFEDICESKHYNDEIYALETRAFEQITRIAIVSAVCRQQQCIEEVDLMFAYSLVKASIATFYAYTSDVDAHTDFSHLNLVDAIKRYLKSNPKGVPVRDLKRRFRRTKPQVFDSAFKRMVEIREIFVESVETEAGRKSVFAHLRK